MKLPAGFTRPVRFGAGSFSTVFRVRQEALGRWVAIKLLPESNPDKRKKILDEARLQAELEIDCVPSVYDAFEWRGYVCIIMKWIQGVPLSHLLSAISLDLKQRIHISHELIKALHKLHQSGYAHGDLKPGNILVSPTDGLVLIDFGFSRKNGTPSPDVQGVLKGTPAYLAPEAFSPSPTTDWHKCDLYSIGKILIEMLGPETPDIVKSGLLSNSPRDRLDNADDLLRLWLATNQQNFSRQNWSKICEQASADFLSEKLYEGALELIGQRREKEAYWLLIECLEVNPDKTEAMEMLDNPVFLRNKEIRTRWQKGVFAFIGILVMAFSFFAGLRWNEKEQVTFTRIFPDSQVKFLPGSRDDYVLPTSMPLLSDSISSSAFSSYLVLKGFPNSGVWQIDGNSPLPTNCMNPCPVDFGMRVLTWENANGKTLYRKKLRFLPFQTRVLHAPISLSTGTMTQW